MSPRPAPTTVLLCRGCCCGTFAKHPDADHLEQELALERVASECADVELRVVDCLDECDRSNVVVIRRQGQPAKQRDTWFGGVVTAKATRALIGWVHDGAPEPAPAPLLGHRFRHLPPRKGRR